MRARPTFQRASSAAAREYAHAPLDRGATPWRSASFCVVDLELSGLDPRDDEIISFAAVPVDTARVVAGDSLYGVVRPTRTLSAESILIHGIRDVDLVEAPPIDEAIQPLIAAMTGRTLVAHVAWVERAFLRRAFARQGIRLREPIIDTYELGRLLSVLRGEDAAPRSLDELAGRMDLPVHRPHHALGDALTTAQVFLALATHLDAFAPETVRSLARAHHRVKTYRA